MSMLLFWSNSGNIRAGDLAASESGADSASATGDVIVQGALSVTESGADTFAGVGDVVVQGSLSAAESGSDTFASVGDVIVQGALAVSETGADTFAGAGVVVVQGALAAAESATDSFAASGTVAGGAATGDLAATESGADGFTASGSVVSPATGGGPRQLAYPHAKPEDIERIKRLLFPAVEKQPRKVRRKAKRIAEIADQVASHLVETDTAKLAAESQQIAIFIEQMRVMALEISAPDAVLLAIELIAQRIADDEEAMLMLI